MYRKKADMYNVSFIGKVKEQVSARVRSCDLS